MKRKIRRTGEIIDVITSNGSTIRDVDWEQRRFDLVKAYSIEFIKMQDRKGEIDCGVYIPDVVSWSITIADRIIEAMRGVKNA